MTNIDEILKDVGKRLTDLRKSKNLTQVQLSNSFSEQYNINIDARSISRYETGKGLPDTDNLIYLADFFCVTTDYILYGKELSDDNSFTWYDQFKRMNRVMYTFDVVIQELPNKMTAILFRDDEMREYLRNIRLLKEEIRKDIDKEIPIDEFDRRIEKYQKDKNQLSSYQEAYKREWINLLFSDREIAKMTIKTEENENEKNIITKVTINKKNLL